MVEPPQQSDKSVPIRRKLPEELLKKSSGSISIKNYTTEGEEEQKSSNDPVDPSHHGSENFTEEEFIKCWNDLAEHIKNSGAEGNTMVYAAMTIYPPQLKDDHKILVQVDNLSQLEEVKQKRTDLHEYLRRELKNGAVEIHVEILKNKKQKKAYTQEEKFNKLAEKNPQLIALKKKLDLDFF